MDDLFTIRLTGLPVIDQSFGPALPVAAASTQRRRALRPLLSSGIWFRFSSIPCPQNRR
jgi:hypothetical protein